MTLRNVFKLFLMFFSLPVFSQNYVGFDLFKSTSIEKITKQLEKSGAENIKINSETERFLYISVEANNYPVANGFVKISVSITDNKIQSIYINDESGIINLKERMIEKYGSPIEVGSVYGSSYVQYNSKNSNIIIDGGSNHVSYRCEKLNQQRMKKLNNFNEKLEKGNKL